MKVLNDLLLKARPIINAVGLEKAAGLPKNTLGRHYRWADGLPHGQPCSPNHFAPIVRALCEVFGCIEVAGWTVRADRTFFVCIKDIPERSIKAKEIKAATSSTFEYKVEQWRCIVDDIDLRDFFRYDC
jgi:hypothetical protein